MNAKHLTILTWVTAGVLSGSIAWADPTAPTTRPAASAADAAPKPAVMPKVPAAGAKAADIDEIRRRTLRYGLLMRRKAKIIDQNERRWQGMTDDQKREALNKFKKLFIYIDEEKLKELYRRQEEFQQLDPATQQRYRRYARQVHELVMSLPAHQRTLLNAMKPEQRKKELIKIIQEMRLNGQWPPKAARKAEKPG